MFNFNFNVILSFVKNIFLLILIFNNENWVIFNKIIKNFILIVNYKGLYKNIIII